MSPEILWLALTLAMTLLFWVPYVLNRMAVRGMFPAMSNPSAADKPQAPWAVRAMAAHTNAIENLVVFAPAAIGVHVLGLGNATTAFACMLYFFSRLAHFIVYTAGIPVLRTIVFFGGWVASVILVLRLLGVI